MLRSMRARASGHRHLLAGSAALVITAGLQAASGALFWLFAARGDVQDDVGHATALFTSIQFVAFLAGLGLPVAVARYAPGRTRDDHVLYGWAVVATSVVGALVALGYMLIVSPGAVEELQDWDPALGPALFVFLVVGTGLTLLLDVRLMTQRRWGLVIWRSGIAAIARFPLLLVPIETHRSLWLFVAVSLPNAVIGVIGTGLLPLVTGDRHRFSPLPPTTRKMVRYSAVNWLSTLAYQAPTFAMPVIVLVNVPASVNASFYVAWGIVALACYIPTAISQALLAEGGRDGAHVRSQVRLALVIAGGLMVVATVGATLGRDIIVSLYGAEYDQAAAVLPPLVAASIPWAVSSVYLSEARVWHRSGATIAITVTLTVAILGPALVLVPEHGLDGAAWAFFGGNTAAAVVALGCHLVARRASPDALAAGHLEAPDETLPPEPLDADDVIGVSPLT